MRKCKCALVQHTNSGGKKEEMQHACNSHIFENIFTLASFIVEWIFCSVS